MEPNKSEQELKRLLGNALSTSSSDFLVIKIFSHLKDLGVESINDFSLVTESDLLPLRDDGFSIIQIRKVMRTFEELTNKENVTPGSSSSTSNQSKENVTPGTSSSTSHQSFAANQSSCGKRALSERATNSQSYTQRENWAENFRVAKTSLSANLRQPLSESSRLSIEHRRQFVREVSDLIRLENPNPGRVNLRTICKNLTKTFPCLSLVLYSGRKIASGDSGLLGCLEARIENLNRKKGRRVLGSDEEDNPEPTRRKVPRKRDTYGCLEGMFNPDTLPNGETKESQQNSREILKEFASNDDGFDLNVAHQLVRETFVTQRWHITGVDFPECVDPEAKLVDVLLETWPILFHPSCANEHMKLLTGEDVIRNIRHFIHEDAQDFLQYISSAGKAEKAWMYVKLLKQMSEWKECGFKDVEIIAVIKALTIYFDEDITSFILVEEPTKLPEEIKVTTLPNTPVLIALGQTELCAHTYMLFVDKAVVNPIIKDPVHATSLWFSMFFMANYFYPESAPFTCEFIQRQISRIDPPTGTRRSKKAGRGGQSVSAKVLTLMTKFDDFKKRLST